MANEVHLRLLRLLNTEPHLTQRDLAKRLGVSLGKTNYCLKALIDKGWVKIGNIYRNTDKGRYLYKLTPTGIAQKAQLTQRFLLNKQREYDRLRNEIEELSMELRKPGER